MPKLSSVYICQQCGFKTPQFLGKCPECGSWGSLVEEVDSTSPRLRGASNEVKTRAEIINLVDIKNEHYQRLSTGLGEFDRVLGGGIVLGSVVLVSGDPGIGKSTLLTQLALHINRGSGTSSSGQEKPLALPVGSLGVGLAPNSGKVPSSSLRSIAPHFSSASDFADPKSLTLYIAGEESAQQIKIRADRIRPKANLAVLNETDVDVIIAVIEKIKPSLVIVDSIQTIETSDLNSVAGSVGQVRESSHRLQQVAKTLHIPIFLVGHVTKEGNIAGPKTLEHLVDVVLSLEGDPVSAFRVLRASKNRFGPTDEVGIFEMGEEGMVEVSNPSKIFLEQKVNAPGSVVVATINGERPLLVEIQALVTKSFLPVPRRVGTGIDNNRLQLLTAVLSKKLGLPLFDQDIFVNVTGGLKVIEPASDLGICLAIISSLKDQAIDPKTVFIGEVGLLGELRAVRQVKKRSAEAKKLGFTEIISPESAKSLTEVVRVVLK